MARKRGPGRPRKSAREKLSVRLNARVKPKEYLILEQQAASFGLKVLKFHREIIKAIISGKINLRDFIKPAGAPSRKPS